MVAARRVLEANLKQLELDSECNSKALVYQVVRDRIRSEPETRRLALKSSLSFTVTVTESKVPYLRTRTL